MNAPKKSYSSIGAAIKDNNGPAVKELLVKLDEQRVRGGGHMTPRGSKNRLFQPPNAQQLDVFRAFHVPFGIAPVNSGQVGKRFEGHILQARVLNNEQRQAVEVDEIDGASGLIHVFALK